MIVRSQTVHDSIPYANIRRSKVEQKDSTTWLVTITADDGRAIVMGRYPNETDALQADTGMWLAGMDGNLFYEFPISGTVTPTERSGNRHGKRGDV